MPHPSHTDLYSTLDPCAINHHQGEGRRGIVEVERRGQMGEGRQESDGEKAIEGKEGKGAVFHLNTK